MGGMPRTSGSKAWLSWRLTPETCAQAQPVVATTMIAASTSRSRYRPPLWGASAPPAPPGGYALRVTFLTSRARPEDPPPGSAAFSAFSSWAKLSFPVRLRYSFEVSGLAIFQAGGQVDAFDGEFPLRLLPSPSHDLESLAGAGVVDVVEDGGLQAAYLVAVVGPGAVVVVESDVTPGQLADPLVEAGVVLLHDGEVAGALFPQVGAVFVLGVESIGVDHSAVEIEGVEQGPEGGDLVALVGDLPLGEDPAGVVHRGQQSDRGTAGCARAAQGFAVHRDCLSCRRMTVRFRRGRTAIKEVLADRGVQGIAVGPQEQAAERGLVRRADDPGQRVGPVAEAGQDLLRCVRRPLPDRERRLRPGQDRGRRGGQQRDGRQTQPRDRLRHHRSDQQASLPRTDYEDRQVVALRPF
jgi:hypothetical protein